MFLLRNFFVNTTAGIDIVNISHEIRSVLRESKVEKGTMTLLVPQEGAGVVALEAGKPVEGLKKELESYPEKGLLKLLIPKTLAMPLEQGKMLSDPWEEVFLVDYGSLARRREFRVQVFWEAKEGQAAK